MDVSIDTLQLLQDSVIQMNPAQRPANTSPGNLDIPWVSLIKLAENLSAFSLNNIEKYTSVTFI